VDTTVASKPSAAPRIDLTPPAAISSVAPEHSANASTANPSTAIRGAAAAPAGVTSNSRADRAAATMTSRDSAFAAWARDAHDLARWQTMSPGAVGEIAQSQHDVAQLSQRVGTAGNSQDVHVMSGQGKDGVGATGGMLSFGLPLLSSGPSRAQRVRDSVVDADVRAGLARLSQRIAAKRDSLRADSLRADSVRKVAQTKRPDER
jgi:hypothetical protein